MATLTTRPVLPSKSWLATELANFYHFNDFKYHDQEDWLSWNRRIWRAEPNTSRIEQTLRLTIEAFYSGLEPEHEDLRKRCIQLLDAPGSLGRFLKSMPTVACEGDIFDQRKHLLTVMNGTVDLRESAPGKRLCPHSRWDFITKMVPVKYTPSAPCPRFMKFLGSTFQGDQDQIDYLQRVLGYSITGETREQKFWIWHGPSGGNGKSTLATVLSGVLGADVYREADARTITGRKKEIPSDIVRLRNHRLVMVQEPRKGAKLNEPVIKSITGQDIVLGRDLYKPEIEFCPKLKLHIQANDLLAIRPDSESMWRRALIIHFGKRFEGNEKILDLAEKIVAREAEGVFAWLVEGAYRYYADGLGEPKAILEATKAYRGKQSVFIQAERDETAGHSFIDQRLVKAAGKSLFKDEVYGDYKKDCEDDGIEAVSKKRFGMTMRADGFEHPTSSNHRLKRGKKDYKAWYNVAFK